MHEEIFGSDLRQEIADAFRGQLVPLSLIKSEKTAAGPTAPDTETPISYPCEGFIEKVRERGNDGTVRVVSLGLIIGGSLPDGAVPENGDEIQYGENKHTIREVLVDPVHANYEFELVSESPVS